MFHDTFTLFNSIHKDTNKKRYCKVLQEYFHAFIGNNHII